MPSELSKRPINVFVHLAAGHDASEWHRRWRERTLIGINDPSPYGYSRANEMGCRVTFSKASPERRLAKLFRLATRVLLGFDYIHARNNAAGLLAADVVWTHTESQFLAVALLFKLRLGKSKRPGLIGQAVWLLDEWPSLSFLHRKFYRMLIRELDVMTVHSPENEAVAKKLFPQTRVEVVLYGIPNEEHFPVAIKEGQIAKVLSVGNDRNRDWESAIKALGNQDGIYLTIVSNTAKAHLTSGVKNVRILEVSDNSELEALLKESTLMLVPLTENKHASGITVLLEAALYGLPILATDTGGLRAYFGDDAVFYLPVSDPDAILEAVRDAAAHPSRMKRQALAAQRRAMSNDMGCQPYIKRHVNLTRELLTSLAVLLIAGVPGVLDGFDFLTALN
jgi:glycosyltransferase involved in cell wall biosynthesis